MLVHDEEELARRSAEIFGRRPGERLVAEEYLPGTLRTMETLGDGVTTWVLGGFRTDLSAPPFFIEERLTWDPPPPRPGGVRPGRARMPWGPGSAPATPSTSSAPAGEPAA